MRVQSNFYVNARLKPPRTLSCISHYTSVVSKVPNSVVAYAHFLIKSSLENKKWPNTFKGSRACENR